VTHGKPNPVIVTPVDAAAEEVIVAAAAPAADDKKKGKGKK
jgi:large subunit ribosomal protein L25